MEPATAAFLPEQNLKLKLLCYAGVLLDMLFIRHNESHQFTDILITF